MNPRDFTRRLRTAVGVVALLVVAAASAQTVDDRPEVKADVVSHITDIVEHNAYVPGVDFGKWPKYLAEVKPKLDAANNDEDFAKAINEALSKFGTTHLGLLTPRRDDSFWTNSMVGIGVSVQRQDDGSLIVVRTVPDAPAARGGIVPGDSIVEVDGKKTEGTTAGIVGKEGTDVNLTIKHTDGKTEHFVLTRRAYSMARPEELTWLNDDTAKLSVYSFDYSYDADNVAHLMKQVDEKAKNLILDLRDNGGGAVINMDHLLGMLMPADKPLGVFVDRRQIAEYVKTGGKATDFVGLAKWAKRMEMPHPNRDVPVFHGNIIVLLNAFSGSASEISAAALHDQVNATVIGTKSAGAVLVSIVAGVSNGFGMQYPLSDFITVKGVRLEGNGVTPDVVAKEPRVKLPGDKDTVVDAAMQFLAQAKKTGGKTGG